MRTTLFTKVSKEDVEMILHRINELNGDGICIAMEVSDRGYDNSIQDERTDISVTIPNKFSKDVWCEVRNNDYWD